MTFAPCFLWIFALAPWIDRLDRAAAVKGALAAVTAAVVGVIAHLSLWFALHTLFRQTVRLGPGAGTEWPVLSSLDGAAALLSLLAALLILRWRMGIFSALALCAAAGLVVGMVGPRLDFV